MASRRSPTAEIKAAYHELARKYHPDRFQSAEHSPELRARAEKLFTYVNRAYSTLSDALTRAEYDAERARKDNQLDSALQARSSTDTDQEKMVDGLYRAGRIALAKGDYERAVTHLKECVWLRSEIAKFHHYLGVAQSGIAKLRKEAERHLLRALELDSTSLDSYMELGKAVLEGRVAQEGCGPVSTGASVGPGQRRSAQASRQHQVRCDLLSRERRGQMRRVAAPPRSEVQIRTTGRRPSPTIR